ncbi:MAG: hypothetical protein IKU44_04450 [Firmicutes bacterium]|nr:hypothetical protein [Bacillota bacterium]
MNRINEPYKVTFLPDGKLSEYLDNVGLDGMYYFERGMFIEYDNEAKKFVACDNRDGCAWVEEFKSLENAVLWLFDLDYDEESEE